MIADEKKRIGQYFSGQRVADLLVHLASPFPGANVIDPMVGCGDMLLASCRRGVLEANCVGIDIDEAACGLCSTTLPNAAVFNLNAFSKKAFDVYRECDWDFVITNPPYVRRELIGTSSLGDALSLEEIRSCLLEEFTAEGSIDAPYITAASNLSGLSDLSAPAWILCAWLVRPGGILAMVVPEAWMTRDYSRPVRELLESQFDLLYVVEDESRKWFAPAQVKTNLVVARKRISEKKCGAGFKHIAIRSEVANNVSLVGELKYGDSEGFKALDAILARSGSFKGKGIVVSTEQAIGLGDGTKVIGESPCSLLETHASNPLAGIDEWGVSIGQGLRTGANDFFYFSETSAGTFSNTLLQKIGIADIPADNSELFYPVLTKQSQLSSWPVVLTEQVKSRVLCLRGTAVSALVRDERYNLLSTYLRRYENEEIMVKGRPKRVPELSAVATNGGLLADGDEMDRYWFMLPRFAARHQPDLIIPRVIGDKIRTFIIENPNTLVVDANFSTICIGNHDDRMRCALLVLLNSVFVQAEIEARGTVMGGGALKCEATMLKKLPIPKPTESLVNRLAKFGNELLNAESVNEKDAILHECDSYLSKYLFPECDACSLLETARNIVEKRTNSRMQK